MLILKRPLSSLRLTLFLLVLLAVLPASGLVIYSEQSERHLASANAQKESQYLTLVASYEEQHLLDQTYQLLATLSHLDQVHQFNTPQCSQFLGEILSQYPQYLNFGVIDLRGDIRCSAVPISGAVNVSDRSYFQQAVQARGFAVGDYQIGRVTGKPSINAAYPVLDGNGQIQAVAYASLSLDWMNDVAAQAPLPAGSIVTVFDRQGFVLANYPDPLPWVGRQMDAAPLTQEVLKQGQGTFEGPALNGVASLNTFTPLNNYKNTYVNVAIPLTQAYAEVNRTLQRNLIGLGLVTLFSLAVAWLVGDLFFVRRIKALVVATQRLADGHLETRSGVSVDQGEIGRLARAFDEMADSLQRQHIQAAQAAEALQHSEERYKALFENSYTIMFLIDPQTGAIVDANPAAGAFYGYSREKLGTFKVWDINTAPREVILASMQEAGREGKTQFSFQHRLANGELRYVEVYSNPVNWSGRQLLFSIVTDITPRKQAEEALRDSEARLNQIIEQMPYPVVICNPDGVVSQANRAFLDLMSIPAADQVIGKFDIFSDHHVADSAVLAEVHKAFQGETVFIPEIPFRSNRKLDLSSQSPAFLEVTTFPVRRENGEIGQVVAIWKDITRRKKAEDDLRRAEEKYRSIFENAVEGLYQTTPEGRFLSANAALARLLGYASPAELIAATQDIQGQIFVDPGQRSEFKHLIEQGEVHGFEWQARRRDGSPIWFSEYAHTVRDEQGQVLYYEGIAQDISQYKQAERDVQRRLDELAALHAVALAGNEASSQDDLIERVTRIIGETLYPNDFGVVLADEANQQWHPHSSYHTRTGEKLRSHPMEIGVIGRVISTRQPVRIPDVREYPGYLVFDEESRSELCVPLVVGERAIGAINTESTQINAFDEADERLQQALAGELATGLERMRLFEAEQRRRQEAEMLREASAALTSTLDLDEVIDAILANLEQTMPFTGLHVMLIADGKLHIVAQRGRLAEQSQEDESNLMEFDNVIRLLETKSPQLIEDTRADPAWVFQPGFEYVRTWMGIPLIVKDRLIGMIRIFSDVPQAYTQEHVQLAMAFANQAAVAIENARLFKAEQQRGRELAALEKVSAAVREAVRLEAMYPAVLDLVLELLQAQAAVLSLREPASGNSVIEMGRGAWASATGLRIPAGRGITNKVIDSGQWYLSDNVAEDRDVYRPEWIGNVGVVLILPLIAHGETIGTLQIGRRARFDQEEIKLMGAVADIVANGIYRANLFEQTERGLQRLSILRTIDMAITSSIDVNLTLNILLEEAVNNLKLDAADVLLYNPATRTLDWAAGRGFHNPGLSRFSQPLSALKQPEERSPVTRAVAERRPLQVNDLSEFGAGRSRLLRQEGLATAILVPFVSKGQVKGVMEIFNRASINPDHEWMGFLESMAGQAAIAIDNAEMFNSLERTNLELSLARDATIEGWTRALDLRDKETENHTQRVTEMTLRLANAMGLGAADLEHVRWGALLHDIGKMGVPDSILLKPGPLTEEEWVVMRRHPETAYELLSPIGYLRPALDIPYCHHEKWDGTGYPRALKGEQIPLAARIFAVVDVWDALTSDRPYRPAWSKEKARAYILEQSGQHFDPAVVAVFEKMEF